MSVILGALGSHVLFGLQLTSTYLLGIFLVLTAMAFTPCFPQASAVRVNDFILLVDV